MSLLPKPSVTTAGLSVMMVPLLAAASRTASCSASIIWSGTRTRCPSRKVSSSSSLLKRGIISLLWLLVRGGHQHRIRDLSAVARAAHLVELLGRVVGIASQFVGQQFEEPWPQPTRDRTGARHQFLDHLVIQR